MASFPRGTDPPLLTRGRVEVGGSVARTKRAPRYATPRYAAPLKEWAARSNIDKLHSSAQFSPRAYDRPRERPRKLLEPWSPRTSRNVATSLIKSSSCRTVSTFPWRFSRRDATVASVYEPQGWSLPSIIYRFDLSMPAIKRNRS